LRINTGLKQFSQEMADEYPIPSGPSHDYPRVLCVAARWEVDSKAADMLAHSLQLQSYATQTWASPLLLQLDSNDKECGMMWGDCGVLYFWIRKEDLQQQRFERCWCVMQCF